MAIEIGSYNFDGPFLNTNALYAQSGVYAILGRSNGNRWQVVDVGESRNVRERVDSHDRGPCWKQRGHQELAVAVLYVPAHQRVTIEQQLRGQFNPPCGER